MGGTGAAAVRSGASLAGALTLTRIPRHGVKHRDSVEAIAGGVLGFLQHPEVVIAGRYADDGGLVLSAGRCH